MCILRRATAQMRSNASFRPRSSLLSSRAHREETDLDAVELVVHRNIKRFFGSTLPAAAIALVTVNGKTMRETMLADRIKHCLRKLVDMVCPQHAAFGAWEFVFD